MIMDFVKPRERFLKRNPEYGELIGSLRNNVREVMGLNGSKIIQIDGLFEQIPYWSSATGYQTRDIGVEVHILPYTGENQKLLNNKRQIKYDQPEPIKSSNLVHTEVNKKRGRIIDYFKVSYEDPLKKESSSLVKAYLRGLKGLYPTLSMAQLVNIGMQLFSEELREWKKELKQGLSRRDN